jgi:hypothetical protein
VTLKKQVSRRSQAITKQIDYVVDRALTGARGNGWTSTIVKSEPTPFEHGKRTIQRIIRLDKKSGNKTKEPEQWAEIYKFLCQAAKTPRGGKWEEIICPQAPEGSEDNAPNPVSNPQVKLDIVRNYSKINIDKAGFFDHLYGLEDHIELTMAALRLADQTHLQKRIHTVYIGPPGCGKTECTLAIGRMLGEENENWLKFDATATTQAGAIKRLMNATLLPPVLIYEEAEKTPDATRPWMLGVLDTRGEVRQTNFRVGHAMNNVKMVCIATVNDEAKFNASLGGALASRFSNKIYFNYPNRDQMRMILAREIRLMNGRMEWIEPTLKFCMDELKWHDPREIIPICLCGQNALLDGTFQAMKLRTLPPTAKQNYTAQPPSPPPSDDPHGPIW